MSERDLWWKIVGIGVLVALAALTVYPPEQKLKFGIDLYGGYSLLYEIDDTGIDPSDKIDLANRVMRVLRDRVDPQGVYNLVWRPVGHNRLEIQMPRPSTELASARSKLEALRAEIQDAHLRRNQVMRALSLPPEERGAEFDRLSARMPDRKPLLEAAAQAYDEYKAEDKTYQDRTHRIEQENLSAAEVRQAVEKPAAERAAAFEALLRGKEARHGLLEAAAKAWDELQAARATSQPTSATSRPDESDAAAKQRAYDDAVRAVLDTNEDPNALSGGATINTVIAREDVLNKAVADVLATNIDTDKLQMLLDRSSRDTKRKDELAEMKVKYSGLANTIENMMEVTDALRKKGHGEGRLEDPADLQRLLRGAGVLEYRILAEYEADKFDGYMEQLKAHGPRRTPGEENFQWFEIEDPKDFLHLTDLNRDFESNKHHLSGNIVCERYGDKFYVLAHIGSGYTLAHTSGSPPWSLKSAHVGRDQNGRPSIDFQLDERGGSQFDVLTRTNIKRQLAIFLDDQAISHATIQSAIRTRGQITGSFSVQEVQEMVKKLDAGSLPSKLKDTPISVRAIGPSLGEANRNAGLRAGEYGAILVAVFMLIYYYYAGSIAIVATALNILLTLTGMALLGATLTLPGIAGLVLAVGMAVDANVLINERIREELAKGTAVRMAINQGYERAFSAILDSNLTTVLTCAILYVLGSEEIKGFGLTLGLGVVINLITAYFMTRVFFEIMVLVRIPRELIRLPLVSAAIVMGAGVALFGLGYLMNDPTARPDSVLIVFGKGLLFTGPMIIATGLLALAFRAIHRAYSKKGKAGIPMAKFIGVPKVDWYSKRYILGAVSAIMITIGLIAFFAQSREDLYDIEFLGGTSAQIDMRPGSKLTRADIANRLDESGKYLEGLGNAVEKATVSGSAGIWTIHSPGVAASWMEPVVKSTFQNDLADINAVQVEDPGAEAITFRTKAESQLSPDSIKARLPQLADAFRRAGSAIGGAQLQAVEAFGQTEAGEQSYEVVTRESNKDLVVAAIMHTLRDDIKVAPALTFTLMRDAQGQQPYFPISSDRPESLGLPLAADEVQRIDLEGSVGGVGMVLDHVSPPQTTQELSSRLRSMRLQPGYEEHGWRESRIFGLHPAADGGDKFDRMMVLVADENYPLDESGTPSDVWRTELADAEVKLLQDALTRQSSLSQVTQFDKQVSGEAQRDALIALILSWLMIIIYLWFRFGNFRWGLAAVAALMHDVSIAAGAVALSTYLSNTFIGKKLLIENFHIDLAMVAAFLTIVGYSVNDTIVVFDRIRENRGRQHEVLPSVINASINQTLSRTLLTVFTVLVAVLTMYIWGGPGIHGFNYAMLVGMLVGAYSSIFIASPLLIPRSSRAA